MSESERSVRLVTATPEVKVLLHLYEVQISQPHRLLLTDVQAMMGTVVTETV